MRSGLVFLSPWLAKKVPRFLKSNCLWKALILRRKLMLIMWINLKNPSLKCFYKTINNLKRELGIRRLSNRINLNLSHLPRKNNAWHSIRAKLNRKPSWVLLVNISILVIDIMIIFDTSSSLVTFYTCFGVRGWLFFDRSIFRLVCRV